MGAKAQNHSCGFTVSLRFGAETFPHFGEARRPACPGLPGTFLVSALKAPCPGKALATGQPTPGEATVTNPPLQCSPTFLAPGTIFRGSGWGAWFQDDSRTLHLLCTLFLLLVAQLLLRSSGLRPWRLETTAFLDCWSKILLRQVRKIPWRREWLPTAVFLPGESNGQRSLAGCRPRGREESDLTERLTLLTFKSREGNHREDIKGAGVIPPREEEARAGWGGCGAVLRTRTCAPGQTVYPESLSTQAQSRRKWV